MTNRSLRSITLALFFLSSSSLFAGADVVNIDACLEAANEIVHGSFVKVEFLDPSSEKIPAYEIEVRDGKGIEWELMCNARTGRIYEIEQEVESIDNPLFASKSAMGERQAIEIALKLYPGVVEEVEYEIESDGSATYEIDLITDNGKEFKVEVDAATGAIIELSVERWEIGEEVNERR